MIAFMVMKWGYEGFLFPQGTIVCTDDSAHFSKKLKLAFMIRSTFIVF